MSKFANCTLLQKVRLSLFLFTQMGKNSVFNSLWNDLKKNLESSMQFDVMTKVLPSLNTGFPRYMRLNPKKTASRKMSLQTKRPRITIHFTIGSRKFSSYAKSELIKDCI